MGQARDTGCGEHKEIMSTVMAMSVQNRVLKIPPTPGMSESYYSVPYGLLHSTLTPFSLHEGCTLIQSWLC